MQLVNLDTGKIIAEDVKLADTFFTRLKGLMFSKDFPNGSALHLNPCRSIHTFFMNFPIDVLYLDEQEQIVGVQENVAPGKLGKSFASARSVVELPNSKIFNSGTKVGQCVQFK